MSLGILIPFARMYVCMRDMHASKAPADDEMKPRDRSSGYACMYDIQEPIYNYLEDIILQIFPRFMRNITPTFRPKTRT